MPCDRRHSAFVSSLLMPLFGLWPVGTVSAAERARPASVRALGPGEQRIVDAARQGAMARLRSPECRALLADFSDRDGRPLEERLTAFALPPDAFLAALPLLDGSDRPLCQANRSHLVTTAGVARVFVCPSYLKAVYQERVMAEVYLIHELLHTLGLGENPPTSQDITRQVVRRCAR